MLCTSHNFVWPPLRVVVAHPSFTKLVVVANLQLPLEDTIRRTKICRNCRVGKHEQRKVAWKTMPTSPCCLTLLWRQLRRDRENQTLVRSRFRWEDWGRIWPQSRFLRCTGVCSCMRTAGRFWSHCIWKGTRMLGNTQSTKHSALLNYSKSFLPLRFVLQAILNGYRSQTGNFTSAKRKWCRITAPDVTCTMKTWRLILRAFDWFKVKSWRSIFDPHLINLIMRLISVTLDWSRAKMRARGVLS